MVTPLTDAEKLLVEAHWLIRTKLEYEGVRHWGTEDGRFLQKVVEYFDERKGV